MAFDPQEFMRNQCAKTFEDLEPYLEQHVAWSGDGKRVLAHAATMAELYKEIDRLGLKDYVLGFVPDASIPTVGGTNL